MIKTAEELKEQAKKVGLSFWRVHNCSMCGYECGYMIDGDYVSYDSGCYCTRGVPRVADWEELARTFNMNQPENNPDFKNNHPDSYKKEYEVWGFESSDQSSAESN